MEELPPANLNDLKKKIITDEIMEYSDSKSLYSLILKLKNDTDEAVSQFQEVLFPLLEELINLSGDHMLTMYKSMIIDFIKTKPKIIIDSLILKCYDEKNGILRANIVNGEESFFMNNNFDDMTEGDSSIINIIFKFKDFWGKLNNDNKEIIKTFLLSIVYLCDQRYINYKKYLCLKKLNTSYTKIFNEMDSFF